MNADAAKPDQSPEAALDTEAEGLETAGAGVVLIEEAMERILRE